jgi:hypothetical protein
MKPKDKMVLDMCIDHGIEMGWARAFKHDDQPKPELIKDCIRVAIEYEIFEWFDFEVRHED